MHSGDGGWRQCRLASAGLDPTPCKGLADEAGAFDLHNEDYARAILAWYDRHRRILPWRAASGISPDPYRVWLSEIMLQQTTVKAVLPRYADGGYGVQTLGSGGDRAELPAIAAALRAAGAGS